MADQRPFEVRLSRVASLMFLAVGALFLFAGLEFAFFHLIFDETIGQEKPLLFWLFNIFAIGIGSAIVLNMAYYILLPPVLMRISAEGVSFGTGFRYTPYLIPLKYLKAVRIGLGRSGAEVTGQQRMTQAGIVLEFERSDDIPASRATSIGITYFDYTLGLGRMYMNRSLQKTVEAASAWLPGDRPA